MTTESQLPFENDLAVAPETGDDFDALNDETFGDAACDEDWEQQHEQLASTLSGPSHHSSPYQPSNLSNFNTSRIPDCQSIEESFHRLSTNSSSSLATSTATGTSIGGVSLNPIAETSNKHLNISNDYFYGKSSLENSFANPPIGSIDSIWSTDIASRKFPDIDNTNIHRTSTEFMEAAALVAACSNASSSNMPSAANQSTQPTRQLNDTDELLPARPVIKRPVRVEDLEAMLLSSSDNSRKTLASVENSSSTNKLENSIINDKVNSGWSPFSMDGFISNIKPTKFELFEKDENTKPEPIGCGRPLVAAGDYALPPQQQQHPFLPSISHLPPTSFNGKPMKSMTLDELERQLLGEDKNESKKEDKPENSLNKFFPGVNMQNIGEIKPIPNSGMPQPPQPNNPIPIVSSSVSSGPQQLINPNPLFNPQFMKPLGHLPNITPFGTFNPILNPAAAMAAARMTFNRIMAPRLLPQGAIPNPAFIQHHQMQQLQQYQQRFPQQRRQFYHHRPGGGRYQHNWDRNVNDDEYAGLMSQRDKEWLIKIQNTALNFANPYKEDFYYVSYKSRQLTAAAKAKEGEGGKKIPSLIIPERKTDLSTKIEYMPVQFEGSLGKIQVSNVKCPRKLLDLDSKHEETIVNPSSERPVTPIGRAELNAFRRLLLEIEKLYVVMLDIDEEDKKMGALPEDQRKSHQDRRSELCNTLFRGVYDERSQCINLRIASVRKGASLIIRSLHALTDPKQKAAIITSLLDDNNIHFILNQRERGLYRLDFKEIILETIESLKEKSKHLPEIDKLTNKLNDISISANKQGKR